MTRTFVEIEIGADEYAKIRAKLLEAGWSHAIIKMDNGEVIDMHGLAVRSDGTSRGDEYASVRQAYDISVAKEEQLRLRLEETRATEVRLLDDLRAREALLEEKNEDLRELRRKYEELRSASLELKNIADGLVAQLEKRR
jgi:hypothetical protein